MQLNVHIILIGKTYEYALAGILTYGNVDKVYLLHSEQTIEVAKKINEKIMEFNISDVHLKKINIFSMEDMVNSITHIAKSEAHNKLFINITGGTNLMAGAACATSYFIGAQAYYIKDRKHLPAGSPMREVLVEIPIPNIRYDMVLDKNQLEVLCRISKRNQPSSNKLLRVEGLEMSAQALSYHLKQLAKKKLITMNSDEKDTRVKYCVLTDVGRLVLSWSKTKTGKEKQLELM